VPSTTATDPSSLEGEYVESLKKLIVALMLLAWAAAADTAAASAETSDVLGNYQLSSFDGTKTRLSSFRGEVVVVNFWASWCPPCLKELPTMNEWHVAWAGRGARVVAISIDEDVRNARRFAEKANLSLDLFHDGPRGLARKLDLPSLPYTVLLDREGNVVSVIRSSSAKDLAALEQKVASLLTSPREAVAQEAGMNAAAGQSTSGVKP